MFAIRFDLLYQKQDSEGVLTDSCNFLLSRRQSQPLERVQARMGTSVTLEEKFGIETVLVGIERGEHGYKVGRIKESSHI